MKCPSCRNFTPHTHTHTHTHTLHAHTYFSIAPFVQVTVLTGSLILEQQRLEHSYKKVEMIQHFTTYHLIQTNQGYLHLILPKYKPKIHFKDFIIFINI